MSKKKHSTINIQNLSRIAKIYPNSYLYKCNIHNCSFKKKIIKNTRFRSGHITNTSFKLSKMENVDFIGLNLKSNNFKNAQLKNVMFFNCNLSHSNFDGAKFDNVYFISCKLSKTYNLNLENNPHIINKYNRININDSLKKAILSTSKNKQLEKYNILLTTNNKINHWMLALLLNRYSPVELKNSLSKFSKTNKKQFYTIFDYKNALDKYLNK